MHARITRYDGTEAQVIHPDIHNPKVQDGEIIKRLDLGERGGWTTSYPMKISIMLSFWQFWRTCRPFGVQTVQNRTWINEVASNTSLREPCWAWFDLSLILHCRMFSWTSSKRRKWLSWWVPCFSFTGRRKDCSPILSLSVDQASGHKFLFLFLSFYYIFFLFKEARLCLLRITSSIRFRLNIIRHKNTAWEAYTTASGMTFTTRFHFFFLKRHHSVHGWWQHFLFIHSFLSPIESSEIHIPRLYQSLHRYGLRVHFVSRQRSHSRRVCPCGEDGRQHDTKIYGGPHSHDFLFPLRSLRNKSLNRIICRQDARGSMTLMSVTWVNVWYGVYMNYETCSVNFLAFLGIAILLSLCSASLFSIHRITVC